DPEDDPFDYPANGGDNDDNESSDDDEDDDDEMMTTVNQRMSIEEIEWVVAQQVANAIEAIAIYETKTNLARKSMSQTKRQKENVAENASNKRKWKEIARRNPTYYGCGNQGRYRIDCPELKNQDHGNQAGGTRAHGMVHALGRRETNQDINDVEDDINA
nr:hypothetical protein [Tanacetum cinerariifolium]